MSHSTNTCQMPVGAKLRAPSVEGTEKQTILTVKKCTFGPVGPILWKMRILFKAENIS